MQASDLLERTRHCAMPEGTIACRGTWLRQEGEVRFAPNRPWLPLRAEQWFRGGGIDFRWEARVRMAPLVYAGVVDCFERGRGMLTARVLGIVPVARSWGPATDKGEAMRGLAELPWRPFAFAKLRVSHGTRLRQTDCEPRSTTEPLEPRSSLSSTAKDT
jgi:hypothetical protein